MQEAWVAGAKLTVQEYIAEAGNLPPEAQEAICPECGKRMTVRAKRAKRDSHFAHVRNSGPCPTKAAAAAPYKTLKPRDPDWVNAALIREFVRENWHRIFRSMQEHIPKLSEDEFLFLLKRAHRNDLWAYRNLEVKELPSLLSVIRDYPDGRGRKYWLRFWFTAATRRPERLWINPLSRGALQRGSYFHPKGLRTPKKVHICRVTEIEFRDPSTLRQCRKPVGAEIVESWLRRQKAFARSVH